MLYSEKAEVKVEVIAKAKVKVEEKVEVVRNSSDQSSIARVIDTRSDLSSCQ